MADMAGNVLYYGDNLGVLPLHIPDDFADLIYLDPPFNSNATYNVLFGQADGVKAAAQIKAFDDTWHWDQTAAESFQAVVTAGGRVASALVGLQTMLGPSTMLAYLSMMAPRLVELRRVLKTTGSIYLHCDPTASHYLKLLMDAVFGAEHFQNEVIWHYQTGGASKVRFSRKHDTILFYSKSKKWQFHGDRIAVELPFFGLRVEQDRVVLAREANFRRAASLVMPDDLVLEVLGTKNRVHEQL